MKIFRASHGLEGQFASVGLLTSIASSNENGSVVAYQYDKLNRLSTVTVPGQSPTLYSYDAVGNLAGYTYPNITGVGTKSPQNHFPLDFRGF